MTDGDKEGSDRSSAGGPLSDTFPEFVKYARHRQKKTRTTPAPNPPPSKITASTVLAAAGAVIVVFGIGAIALISRPDPAPAAPSPKSIRASAELYLPKPAHPGQVPDMWAGITLGEPLEKLDARRLRPYSGNDSWADHTYTPDLARPDAFLGLSVHKGRVYKISMRLGESSTVPAGPYIASAQMAYGGNPVGYEYLTPGHSHAVTIFQTQSRALRLDSLKGEEITLFEAVLIDMDAATERELARARGQK